MANEQSPKNSCFYYFCNACQYKCYKQSDSDKHFLTAKHKRLTNTNEKSPKIAKTFCCKTCHYTCCKQSEYDKHISTNKHKRLNNEFSPVDKTYYCKCGKTYNHMSSLCKHKKTCIVENIIVEPVVSEPFVLNNEFDKCIIDNARQGFALGFESATLTNPNGPRETSITNTKFYNVKQQAVFVNRGFGNAVKGCKFYNVGSDGGGYELVAYPEIFFNVRGNSATENYSTRSVLGTGTLTTAYVPELAGYGEYRSFSTKYKEITPTVSPEFAFRLPCATGYDGVPSGVKCT
jgi:hypothetical protein